MAAPSIVQSASSALNSNALTHTVSFDETPTVGRLIVVFAFTGPDWYGAITDNQGNTYTERGTQQGYAGVYGRIYTAPATTSTGTFTITSTAGANVRHSIIAFEVADYDAASVFEQVDINWENATSSANFSPLGFGATTEAEQLFLAAFCWVNGQSKTVAAGSGWTLEETGFSDTSILGYASISKAVTSTGTYDPEMDCSASLPYGVFAGISIVGGTDGASGPVDIDEALGGSASTTQAGTAAPGTSIGL